MQNSLTVQNSLINIYKAGISKENIKDVIKTIHNEIIKLIGKEKALNFYIALHIKDAIYTIPYCVDEKDDDPIDMPISLESGLTEYIRKMKKSILIDSAKYKELQENGTINFIGTDSYNWIGCPLIFKRKFFGVMAVQTYDKDINYTKSDLQIINFVSKNISITIARMREAEQLIDYKKNLEIEVLEKNRTLINTNKKLQKEISKVKKNETIQRVLFNISELKNRILSTKDLIKKIHIELSILVEVENFYVAIKQGEKKGEFLCPFFRDVNPEEISRVNKILNIPDSFTDFVYTTQKPLLATQKKLSQIEKTSKYKMVGMKPQIWVGIPLKTKDNTILGVVTIQDYSNPKAYSKKDLRLLSLISTTIADALDFRRLEDHKKQLEARLIDAKRMETIGIFAAGIAHEFNNLLSIIIGNAHLGLVSSDPKNNFYTRFSKIIKSGESASELIEKLMVFTNLKPRSKFISYNIKEILNTTIQELIIEKKTNASFRININDELWPLNMAEEDIIIVFSNILSNAIDAMQNDGVLEISISNFNGNLKESCVFNEKYLTISFRDNGIGIDKKIIDKIFDPFFTTKEPGKGTGLGLYIVYAIVKQYEGEIKFISEINKGTTVEIYLPIGKRNEERKKWKKEKS